MGDPPAPTDALPDVLHATTVDGDPVTISRATAADEVDLQRFFASVTMDADLQLAVHREPSLLAMYDIQAGSHETWIGRLADGELVGMGTLMAGERYVDGTLRRVGYLGDLRLDRRVRGRSVLAALYGRVLDDFARRHDVEVFLTAVIASNQRAIRALTGPKAAEVGIPTYHLLTRFDIRAVQLLTPRRLPRVRGLHVRRATVADIPAIADLLGRDARSRPWGIPVDEAELRRRLDTWTGLVLENFILVLRAGPDGDTLVACQAIWDLDAYKQTVAVDYRGSMRRIRTAYNAAARVLRARPLPRAGNRLPYAYATHHAVLDGDASDQLDAQRLLLAFSYRELRRTPNVFLSCFVPKGDPLRPAWRGYVTTDLPAHLYAVVPFGGDLPDDMRDLPGRPGFEMALV